MTKSNAKLVEEVSNLKPLDQALRDGDELCVYEMDKDNLPYITNEWCTYENVQAYLKKALAKERERIVNDAKYFLRKVLPTSDTKKMSELPAPLRVAMLTYTAEVLDLFNEYAKSNLLIKENDEEESCEVA